MFLSSIIRVHVDGLFPGLDVGGCYQFRVTRNSNLYVDDEEVSDLVLALEGQLEASRYGAAVRIEIGHECPDDLLRIPAGPFRTRARRHLHGRRSCEPEPACDCLRSRESSKPALSRRSPRGCPQELRSGENIFSILDEKNVLLAPSVPVLRTGYRLCPHRGNVTPTSWRSSRRFIERGPDSPIVGQLVTAARSGKEVTVVIELMARFDEAANIALANRLQEAGAHVVYGLVGFKTHCENDARGAPRRKDAVALRASSVPATTIMRRHRSTRTTATSAPVSGLATTCTNCSCN